MFKILVFVKKNHASITSDSWNLAKYNNYTTDVNYGVQYVQNHTILIINANNLTLWHAYSLQKSYTYVVI